MRSGLCVLLFVAWANALPAIPLGYTLTPKIPVANVPIIANVPITTTVPIVVPSCGCGLEVATVVPTCGCVDKIVSQRGCGCDTLLLESPILTSCGCLETSPSCGCVERALVNPCGCGLPVTSCGCNGCGTCGCGYNPCVCAQSACLTVDPVTTCGCTVPALQVVEVPMVPTCATPCTVVSTCGCPTLPPFPPVVGCCGKYLRKICVQPPFL